MTFAQLVDIAPDWFWNGLLVVGLAAPIIGLIARSLIFGRKQHWASWLAAGSYYFVMSLIWYWASHTESPGSGLAFVAGLFIGPFVGLLTVYD